MEAHGSATLPGADSGRAPPSAERRRLRVTGIVQGVGFRPFVHGLAAVHGVGGFVLNDGDGVRIEVEGSTPSLEAFVAALGTDAPAPARVDAVDADPTSPIGERSFRIATSECAGATALVPADAATCEDCLAELLDPADRRFRYPFITCARCGPRFTIADRLPYDRATTTMRGFAMCPDCRREYEDPGDRRFHAETIACSACGPRLSMPLSEAVRMLSEGAILAVKGIGGYHLACDARSEAAVATLRERKRRDAKPFALMSARPEDVIEEAGEVAAALRDPARPIVLARRRPDARVASAVAPESRWLGVMLPYSPIHHLLVRDFDGPLVMTSGNVSDEPIAVDDLDARDRLETLADAFLTHDRPIRRRCEDSVIRPGEVLRRSRGHAPLPRSVPVAAPMPVVATGAELKSTFCVVRRAQAFLSPHLGDLTNAEAYRAFRDDLALYLEMLGVRPAVVAHDLHPDYLTTQWALGRDAELIGVQHHHAHAAACLAEHGRSEAALGIVLDGGGFGPDGAIWGGELLRVDLRECERLAHLEAVEMPGGEAAIREPWRMAAAYLERAGRPVPLDRWPRWPVVRQSLAINAPASSGAGRLFDAVAALLGVRDRVTYEGQAAVELEELAADVTAAPHWCRVEAGTIHGADLVGAAADDLGDGRPRREVAAAFHEGLAAALSRACGEAAEPGPVVLSGGTMQNLRLVRSISERLGDLGFDVLRHRSVPPNDGGISFGQAAIAAARMSACA